MSSLQRGKSVLDDGSSHVLILQAPAQNLDRVFGGHVKEAPLSPATQVLPFGRNVALVGHRCLRIACDAQRRCGAGSPKIQPEDRV